MESRYRAPRTIECCHHCVPPKRHPGCHDRCPEYAEEKAVYEQRKLAYYGDPIVQSGLTFQRNASVERALRRRRNSFRNTGKGRFSR